ncbi:MAG: hypothetical protein PHI72_10295 [Atribacterota bacterium]|nr:hypothetical protein [Atribacterota bacterium]MDD4895628.1 hypothetical protein [Atribacterota bacterium]MDD5638185.1 hypothetical protein [Atribacterota bacterium]
MVLQSMGIPTVNVTAIVFIGVDLSVVTSTVNVYTMIISSGVNMPYIGFFILPILF